jgi:hypothetical protein
MPSLLGKKVTGTLPPHYEVTAHGEAESQSHPLPRFGCSMHQHQHGSLLGRLYHILDLQSLVLGSLSLAATSGTDSRRLSRRQRPRRRKSRKP